MTQYVVRRLFYTVFIVWGAVTIIFVVMRFVPGDPAIAMLGATATQEQIAQARTRLGLDEPVLIQYGNYLARVIRLDFGESFRLGGSAMGHVVDRLPLTLCLALGSTAFAVLLGFPLGILAARNRGRLIDQVVTRFSLVGQALPTFWTGIMLILIFSRTLGLLPSGGASTWRHFILPIVALGLPFMSIIVRLARGGLLDVLNENFVQVARAKGLPERRVVYRHAARTMLLPVVTIIGLQLGVLVGGAVIVETVFSWPGLGRLLIDAIRGRDYPIVQAATALIAVIFVLLNLVVDMTYAWLDPRVRVAGGAS
jgi:ABC-type dipeptide/oligopeptide/nickel transport system permease component